ncbi:uncharacterized protein LOC144178332 [Haemaphysalis longicornis]
MGRSLPCVCLWAVVILVFVEQCHGVTVRIADPCEAKLEECQNGKKTSCKVINGTATCVCPPSMKEKNGDCFVARRITVKFTLKPRKKRSTTYSQEHNCSVNKTVLIREIMEAVPNAIEESIVCSGEDVTFDVFAKNEGEQKNIPDNLARSLGMKNFSVVDIDVRPLTNVPHHQQVSTQRPSPSGGPSRPSFPPLTPDPLLEAMKELRALRADFATLRQETAALKRELQLAKRAPSHVHPHPPAASEPGGSPPTSRTVVNSGIPPAMRIAVSINDSPCAIACDEKFAILERSLASQREEYLHVHNTLLANQRAMQSTLEMITNNLRNFFGSLDTAHTAPLPFTDGNDE